MKRIGLALSGGGYRAAAFHLGTLRALHKLGLLEKIDVISTISGGSITGAAWALSKKDFPDFEKEMVNTLHTKSVIAFIVWSWMFWRLLLLSAGFVAAAYYLVMRTHYPWTSFFVLALLLFILLRFQFRLFPVSKRIEQAYDRFFFGKRKLKDLPDRPDLAIGSTNLLSTTPFTFAKRKMGDTYFDYGDPVIKFKPSEFPIARAVVASSCVPFAFTPVTIGREFFEDPTLFDRTDTKLVDGGVYDNQGIHKVTHEKSSWYCPIVIVSDAGNKLPFEQRFPNTIALLIRTVDVFMDRIKAMQMMANVYQRTSGSDEEIAFISLGWDLENCIPGFVDNLIAGTIPKAILTWHMLEPQWLAKPSEYRKEIINHLSSRVVIHADHQGSRYKDALRIAREVGTSLTSLSMQQIEALSTHAELFTDVQVKLYCPSLLNKRN